MSWGYGTSTADGECLTSWASSNGFTLLYSPKDAASFHSGRWHTDLAFASVDLERRLPDRRILEKFPRSQHRPSLITPSRLAHPKPSKPVKRWNFRKANWSHYSSLTNKLARTLPPPDQHNTDQAYQCLCKILSTAARKCIPRGRRTNHIPCWDAECEDLYQRFRTSPEGLVSSRAAKTVLTGNGNVRIDGQRQSAPSTSRTPAG